MRPWLAFCLAVFIGMHLFLEAKGNSVLVFTCVGILVLIKHKAKGFLFLTVGSLEPEYFQISLINSFGGKGDFKIKIKTKWINECTFQRWHFSQIQLQIPRPRQGLLELLVLFDHNSKTGFSLGVCFVFQWFPPPPTPPTHTHTLSLILFGIYPSWQFAVETGSWPSICEITKWNGIPEVMFS